MTFRRFLSVAVLLAGGAALVLSCKDLGNAPAVNALRASATSVNLAPGGQTTIQISGGNPPFTIADNPSASIATAVLTNLPDLTANLLISALSSATVGGATSVRITDTDPHASAIDGPLHEENEILITISIASPGAPVAPAE